MVAKGVELASGYISLSVQYSGAMAQIAKDLDRLEESGKKSSKKISSAIENDLDKAAKISEKKLKAIDNALAEGTKSFADKAVKAYQRAQKAREEYLEARKEYTELNKLQDENARNVEAVAKASEKLKAAREKDARATALARKEVQAYNDIVKATPSMRRELIDRVASDSRFNMSSLGSGIANLIRTPINAARTHAGTALSAIGRGIRTTLGGLASAISGPMARIAGMTAVLGGVGYVFNKGFQQVANLDRARKTLEALGRSTSDFNKMMEAIERSSKGTQYSISDLVQTSTKAIQAGIEPGAPLQQYLTKIQDMAAATNKSIVEIDALYDRAKLRAQVYLDDLRQLTSDRAPVEQWVTEDLFSGSREAMQYALENNMTTWDQILGVVERRSKGVAVAMGNTLEGQLKRIGKSVSDIGAAILEPFFGSLGGGFEGVIEKLDGFAVWLREHQPEIIAFVENVAKAFTALGASLLQFAADSIGAIQAVLGAIDKIPGVDMSGPINDLEVWKDELEEQAWLLEKRTIPAIEKWSDALQSVAKFKSAIATKDEDGRQISWATPKLLDNGRVELIDFKGSREELEDLGFKIEQMGDDPTHIVLQAKTEEAKKTIDGLREAEGKEPLFFTGRLEDEKFKKDYADLQKHLDKNPLEAGINLRDIPVGGYVPPLAGWPGGDWTGVAGSGGASWFSGRGSRGGGSYGLPALSNSNGYGGDDSMFPPWVRQVEKLFGVQASTYPNHQTDDRPNEPGYAPNPRGLNRGIDWVGPVQNMERLARYLESVAPAVEQVIWQNPQTGRRVGVGGSRVNPGYYPDSTYMEHANHVHTRHSMPIPLPGMGSRNFRSWGPMMPAAPGFPAMPKSFGSITVPATPSPTPPPTPDVTGGVPHGGVSNPLAGQLDPYNTGRRAPNPWGYGKSPSDILQEQQDRRRAQESLDQMVEGIAALEEELKKRADEIQREKDNIAKGAAGIDPQMRDQKLAELDAELADRQAEIDDAKRQLAYAKEDMALDQMRWDEDMQKAQWDAMNQGKGQQGGWPGGPILPDLGELGNIMQGGLAETFLPPGFSNPFDTPILKAGAGILSFIGGLMPDPFTRGIFQAAAGVMGGSGGQAGSAIMSMIPQPFGTMQPASPGYAPGADFITPGSGPGMQLPVGAAIPGVQQLTQQPGPYGPPTGPLPGPAQGGNTTINLGPNYQGASIGQPGKDFVDMQQRDAQANARSVAIDPQRIATKGP